jgi:hypothetical protein
LVVNVPLEEFQAHLKKYHGSDLDSDGCPHVDAVASVIWEFAPYYYIWFAKWEWTIDKYAELAHELSHHTDFVLDNAGIDIGINNTEVKAYYTQYLFKTICNKLQKVVPEKKVDSATAKERKEQ